MRKKIVIAQKITAICGSENHLIDLMKALDKSKYDIHFLMLQDPKIPVPRIREKVLRAGAHLHVINIRSTIDLLFFTKLFLFFIKNRFDLIHTNLIHADLFVTIASILTFNGKRISSKHADNSFRKDSFIGWLDGKMSFFQKRVIVISEFLKNFYLTYEKIPESKIDVVKYSYKSRKHTYTRNLRDDFKISNYSLILLIVARLVPYKGHIVLLEAFKRVLERFPEIKLFIVGDGPERTNLNKFALENSMQKSVIFTGYRPDTHEFYKEADIVLLASETEGFGLTTLEAMDHSKPLIVSKSGAMPEIVIDNETGLLFPPGNEYALYNKLVELIESKKNRDIFGKNGKKRLLSEFSHEVMVKKVESIYDSIIT